MIRKISIALLFITGVVSTTSTADMRPREQGMFQRFDANKPARDRINNYLLMELSNFVYGNKLLGNNHRDSNDNSRFKNHFIREKGGIFHLDRPNMVAMPTAPRNPLCFDTLAKNKINVNGFNTPKSLVADKRVQKILVQNKIQPSACGKAMAQYKKAYASYKARKKHAENRNRAANNAYNAKRFQFEFFHANGRDGRGDPEVLIAYNSETVIAVFRGTDRVDNALTDLGFEWSEWIGTNFNFTDVLSMRVSGSSGLVHPGFYNSLNPIRNRLLAFFDNHSNKKIWITGHSLGGVHAQVLATDLKLRRNIPVKGLVVFASPQLGDPTFARWFDSNVTPGGKFQRYDFSDDIVPQVFPIPGADKAGQRNWFKSERGSANFFPHYKDREAITVADGFLNLLPDLCMHHQEWYRRAMYFELDNNRGLFPSPPPAPNANAAACRQSEVDRARQVTN